MAKWEYATLWFTRDTSTSPTQVFLITSSERRKLGQSAAGGPEDINQSVVYWADYLGEDGWEAFSTAPGHILFRRPRPDQEGTEQGAPL